MLVYAAPGAVPPRRPAGIPRRRRGLAGHYSGVPEPLRQFFLAYCAQAAATRAPASVKCIAVGEKVYGLPGGAFARDARATVYLMRPAGVVTMARRAGVVSAAVSVGLIVSGGAS